MCCHYNLKWSWTGKLNDISLLKAKCCIDFRSKKSRLPNCEIVRDCGSDKKGPFERFFSDTSATVTHAIAVSKSVTNQEADLGKMKADLSNFFGYECYSDPKKQERVPPRTWGRVLRWFFISKSGLIWDPVLSFSLGLRKWPEWKLLILISFTKTGR